MPRSIRNDEDGSSLTYEIADQLPLHKDRAVVVRTRKSLASLAELPPSPADSDEAEPIPMPRLTATDREADRITVPLERGTPGDQAIDSSRKTPEQRELARRKSQYYRDVFALREPANSARERASRDSMVMADVRTNVIIQDEYTFITDLSSFLSTRYQRPESSVIVSVTHSACLLFGGSFDPAYTMTITALPSQVQPITNLRNTILIQKHLEESFGVVPQRGLLKFSAITEENYATNSQTVAAQIDTVNKEVMEEHADLKRSFSRANKRRQSTRSLKVSSPLPTHPEQMSTPPTSDGDTPPLPAIPTERSSLDRKAEKLRSIGRRKSFIASMFGKKG